MTQRRDGKPKKINKKHLPKNHVDLMAYWDRAYTEGYRDALKLFKHNVDEQLRETK